MEGEGPANGRQRADTLFHRAHASPARSRDQSTLQPLIMKFRDLTRTGWFQRAAGGIAAEFLRVVWWTNRFAIDPPDIYERIAPDMPVIVAFWHGQHFMM